MVKRLKRLSSAPFRVKIIVSPDGEIVSEVSSPSVLIPDNISLVMIFPAETGEIERKNIIKGRIALSFITGHLPLFVKNMGALTLI